MLQSLHAAWKSLARRAHREQANYQPDSALIPTETFTPVPRGRVVPLHGAEPSFGVDEIISGRYVITAFLGRGGMGEVYSAQDLELGIRVALKTISVLQKSSQNLERRFKREIELARKVGHPNVCQVYDFHRWQHPVRGDVAFLTMEFLEGETLASRLSRGGRLTEQEALGLVAQIVSGLSAIHRADIVHRDLKPSNLMLITGSDCLKILDFGLARRSVAEVSEPAELTVAGEILGTPAYMAPEQFHGVATAQSDIYALGEIIYEILTGRRPSSSALEADAKYRPSVREVLPNSYPVWDAVIRKCMQPSPTQRFQSADEILRELQIDVGAPVPHSVRQRSRRRFLWPAAVLACATGALLWKRDWLPLKTGAAVRSIAVLPFTNVENNPEWEYLATGLTENMINSLSVIPGLTVMSRAAVYRLQREKLDAIGKGRKLGVEAVLTGALRNRGATWELSTELVEVRTGRQIWGGQYQKPAQNLLDFQRDAAREILLHVRDQVGEADKKQVVRNYTNDPEAWRLYLKGRHEWNKRTAVGYRSAIDYYTRAIERDPSYALAYSGLADAYSVQGGAQSPGSVFPRARSVAVRALELDPNLAEAHASLGFINLQYDWNWAGAEREYRRALELNENYATAHSMYSRLCSVLGRFDEADAQIARAQQLDPLSIGIANGSGYLQYLARRYQRAEAQFRANLVIEPQNDNARSYLAYTLVPNGRSDEAIRIYEELLGKNPSDTGNMADLARAYAVSGNKPRAAALLRQLKAASGREYVLPTLLAQVSAALGGLDEAITHLERAYEDRTWQLIFLAVEPVWDNLRGHAGFTALVRKMNL